jgi:hypothetical protein
MDEQLQRQTPLLSHAWYSLPLNPVVPLHQLHWHGSGHGENSPPPPSLNSPSTSPRKSSLTRLEHPSVLCSRRSSPLPPPQPPMAGALELHRPSTPPAPPSPAFKRHPRSRSQTHTVPSYLLDNTVSPLMPDRALHRQRGAPSTPRIPGDSEPSKTCRRSRAAEKDRRSSRDTSPPLPAAAGELPDPRHSPRTRSLAGPRRDGEDHPGPSDRF